MLGGLARFRHGAGGRRWPPDRRLCLPAQRSGRRLRPEAHDRRRGPAPAREARNARDLHPEPRSGRHRPGDERADRRDRRHGELPVIGTARNTYPATDPERFTNPAVSRQYEPGSATRPSPSRPPRCRARSRPARRAPSTTATSASASVTDPQRRPLRLPIRRSAPSPAERSQALRQHRGRQDRPDARAVRAVRRVPALRLRGRHRRRHRGEAPRRRRDPDGPQRLGRPDHGTERFRPGAHRDRRPARRWLRRDRQRRDAGDAARRRRLDRRGRRLPRTPSSQRRADDARVDRRTPS